jgi:uncharacterized paraquat-inducible protein A
MIPVICPTCGSRYKAEAAFAGRATKCPNCGAGLTIPPHASAELPRTAAKATTPIVIPKVGTDGYAIAGLLFGIIALVVPAMRYIALFAFAPAFVGLVCSIVAISNAVRAGRPKAMAVTGFVCSMLALVWTPILVWVLRGGSGPGAAQPW